MTKIAKTAAQMCGLIIEPLGWEAVFYITAGITVLWVIVWQVATKILLFNFPDPLSPD